MDGENILVVFNVNTNLRILLLYFGMKIEIFYQLQLYFAN